MNKNCTSCYYCKNITLKGYTILNLNCKQNIKITTTLDQIDCSTWKPADYKPVALEELKNINDDYE
jgi:hypothetical protein